MTSRNAVSTGDEGKKDAVPFKLGTLPRFFQEPRGPRHIRSPIQQVGGGLRGCRPHVCGGEAMRGVSLAHGPGPRGARSGGQRQTESTSLMASPLDQVVQGDLAVGSQGSSREHVPTHPDKTGAFVQV